MGWVEEEQEQRQRFFEGPLVFLAIGFSTLSVGIGAALYEHKSGEVLGRPYDGSERKIVQPRDLSPDRINMNYSDSFYD